LRRHSSPIETARVRDLLAQLARADRSRALPRLGGMARPDGVVIVSERFWAFAGVDGSFREGAMPNVPAGLVRIPLVRGLARLGLSLAPLFSGRGVARRRERLVLAAAVLAPAGLVFAPSPYALIGGLVAAATLLVVIFRGRTLHLHGAEHRAIAAAEERRLEATWNGTARPTRFAARCGTNFAALSIPIALAGEQLWPLSAAFYTPVVVTALSLALTMELWRVVQSARGWRRSFLLPGLALQRVTTREPRLEETRVALAAVASVLRRELRTG
jgi:hypothetical protein